MMKRTVLLMMLAVSAPGSVRAQVVGEELPVPRVWGGLNLLAGVPTGEFKQYIDAGIGLNANLVVPVTRGGPFAIRADMGFLVYGSETQRVCFSETVGCLVQLDLTTTNSIGFGSIGPQLMLPTGRVRPYANAGVGFGYFFTQSSVSGTADDEDFARTTNHDDATWAWSGGGGILFQLSNGRTPVALDIGTRYNSNGSVEYLKEGDISENPDGSVAINPTRSEANLFTINLGVSIGFRPGMSGDPR